MELRGTVAIVTGENGGLGQRICHALAQAGSQIVVVYTQSQGQAQDVADHLYQTGVQAEAMACDVTHPQQVQQLVARVAQMFGRVDILVNDAAYNKWIAFQDLDAMTYEEWQKILDVNLTGPMLYSKAVAPTMRQQGHGRIVNIASVAGLMPSGSSIPYAVSKAGLIHLTRCMASGPWWNQIACCGPRHSKRGSMPIMAVRVKHIWSCPKRLPDYALGSHVDTHYLCISGDVLPACAPSAAARHIPGAFRQPVYSCYGFVKQWAR